MTYREFCVALKDILGAEDYQWLIGFAEAHKEKEIEEAKGNFEIEKVDKLTGMSAESYMFHALSDSDLEKKLKQSGLAAHDAKRIGIIVAKLRFEKSWLDETRV